MSFAPALALPHPEAKAPSAVKNELTLAQLKAAVKNPCNPATQPECTPLEQALGPLQRTFEEYKIYTPGQQAAAIAIMAFESGGFAYKTNLNPANYGQGTYAQMQYPSIEKYVSSIKALSPKFQALVKPGTTVTDGAVKNKVLKLVTSNLDYCFGAAPWYMSNKATCDPAVFDGLSKGTDEAYKTYLSKCINTGIDTRMQTWHDAIAALQ
ncbi:hypothetical protein IWQ60_004365 [Tieghemiomyces parasiticus]|uniref:Uncharacterized protein n=1 Tax=Tieghemiomyces parasiticus TaxID=78921 RepID=A0A9W8DVL5_9FUNG|nr:hypothetical protein IWQ60_004365 [Tieghemiomyces parasiticus]